MKPLEPCVVAHVTAPNMEVARAIARTALEAKVAACANILPQIESHYWWQGKLEQSAEALIIFKTTAEKTIALQETVLANHPYQTPEFITFHIDHGAPAYMQWIAASVRPS